MPQLKSSNALTTSRHTNTTRSYGRGRRVTTFTAPAPVKTDPARDLVAAVYAWGRIAVPVAEPDPCPVAWCMDCLRADTVTAGFGPEDGGEHRSAAAIVEADSHNRDGLLDAPGDGNRSIKVTVVRFDEADGTIAFPAIVGLEFGDVEFLELPAGKIVELVAALNKARTSAQALTDRATGAVSVVRVANGSLQIGALFDQDGPVIFINSCRVPSAHEVREMARGERFDCPPHTWDLDPDGAAKLAAALDAAAALAAADRAVTA